MDKNTIQTLFALIRCAIRGGVLTEAELNAYDPAQMMDILRVAKKHDVAHLAVWALKQNGLLPKEQENLEKVVWQAVYRYERLNDDYLQLCDALEKAEIDFLPLKGSVLRRYYPEPWMRTSCDVDILVHKEDLEDAISYLKEHLEYVETERATHDVSLFSPSGNHIELHFDLVEEGRANNAIAVLADVWNNATLCENCRYRYEMTDPFFYFYHIAHMAKHFENGGCGIRPFVDLWILDHMKGNFEEGRCTLLQKSGLWQFATVAQKMSRVWIGGEEMDALSEQMQTFILSGGVYGTYDNRVALQQKKKGGRFGYFMSRVFAPYDKLKRYYPILEKHRWLMPVMQVRRWFMLLRPDVAKMARREIAVNSSMDKSKAEEMKLFLDNIGL